MLDVAPTPAPTLIEARRIALQHGLRYVYTGNIRDPAGQTTWCHGCGARLIGRDGYEITAWGVSAAGACRACGTRLPGVLDAQPGRWGGRRARLAVGAGLPA
jgi:pyruvate formate lyase activating enzyme